MQVERFYVSAATSRPPSPSSRSSRWTPDSARSPPTRAWPRSPRRCNALTLFEPHGPLVSANRGLIEYSDLLKRPLEAFKYLLGTSETGRVPLEHFLLQLDLVLIASANEKQLSAFKEIADFASFRGRLELIRVPYLRRASVEREIYDQQVTAAAWASTWPRTPPRWPPSGPC